MIANHMSLIFAVLTGGEGPRKSSRRLRINSLRRVAVLVVRAR